MNNIRILYGNPVFRELLEVEFKDDTYKFKMHALITNANYTNKKMIFLLFINNRLVKSSCKCGNIKIKNLVLVIKLYYINILFQLFRKC